MSRTLSMPSSAFCYYWIRFDFGSLLLPKANLYTYIRSKRDSIHRSHVSGRLLEFDALKRTKPPWLDAGGLSNKKVESYYSLIL